MRGFFQGLIFFAFLILFFSRESVGRSVLPFLQQHGLMPFLTVVVWGWLGIFLFRGLKSWAQSDFPQKALTVLCALTIASMIFYEINHVKTKRVISESQIILDQTNNMIRNSDALKQSLEHSRSTNR